MALLGGLALGSHARNEMLKAIREGERSYAAVYWDHPEWQLGGRISDAGVRRDMAVERLAKLGSSMVAQGRRGVARYESFCKRNSALIDGGSPYPATEDLVAWATLDVLDLSRAKKAAKEGGSAFKGTAGGGFVKQLGYAVKAFGAPFAAEVLGSSVVEMARKKPPDAAATESEEAHMAAWVQCFLEETGRYEGGPDGAGLDEVAVDFARTFAVMGLVGFRDVEGLRARVAETSEDGVGVYAVLACTGAKAATVADAKPFEGVYLLSRSCAPETGCKSQGGLNPTLLTTQPCTHKIQAREGGLRMPVADGEHREAAAESPRAGGARGRRAEQDAINRVRADDQPRSGLLAQ